jgi:hypothetical protein
VSSATLLLSSVCILVSIGVVELEVCCGMPGCAGSGANCAA